jgi:DHA1 family inner membrane transport protein
MAFLANKTVNLLNLHYGLLALAMSGGGVFFAVFLLKAGVAPPAVLGAYALILAARFTLRPVVLPLGKRIGLKALVILGTVLMALQWPILALVHGVSWTLLWLCLVAAVGDMFYWTSYHAYFARVGDAHHRGHQTSAREALAAVVGIIAPIVGGWTLSAYGPAVAFGATAAVNLTAALPLLGAPRVAVAAEAPGAFRAALPGLAIFLADGWMAAGFNVVWQIALFGLLAHSFTAFGGAMAVAALTGAVAGLLLGRHIDAGHGTRAVWVSVAAAVVTILARAGATDAALAVFANALGALAGCLYTPTMMTPVYNLAQRSPCPLRFQLVAEGAWDVGHASACLAAAGLLLLGVPLQAAILLSLIGAAAVGILMRRYYLAGFTAEAPA